METETMTSENILVVANEKFVRLTLTKATQDWGFATIEAATVSESLKLFDLHHPVVTLLEINLPDGSG
ncbi:MAG: sigma-54-dependent Fis family transcriptional regulator, partial [Actinomycetota bacterium]